MGCKLIDGKSIAAGIRERLRQEVRNFRSQTGVQPTLVALLVGDNPASQIYVNKKMQAADEVGILSYKVQATSDVDDIQNQIRRLNNDDSVHGYIIQLPLPDGLDPLPFFSRIDPFKDVDVFHPENVGLLVQGRPRFKPCTPHGIQVMLHRSGIQVAGKKVVIINRSNVVGKPLSSMLIQDNDEYANATVTVCHDQTPPGLLKQISLGADIVVVAVGKPGFLTPDMVAEGAVVVDVGITRLNGKILGDCDPGVAEKAGWLTPVPGGVGPLTVAMLLENTLAAAKLQVSGRLYNRI